MANFDIFLSHNSRDKPAVERIAMKLKQGGLEPWLDKWCLTPGGKWQEELAAGLRASSACGFFIGPNGVGDWASEELNVALDRAAKDRIFRLFLVLLPAVPEPFDATSLPPFLSTRTWIDLRKGIEDSRGFQLLINAIKGVAPGPEMPIEARAGICPYRGLQTFNEEDVEFFFGRNGDIQRLVEKLKATRFFAVLGPSGSGKSSVVRAGLIPRLRAGALPDSNTWTVRLLTPGSHPLTALAAHLLRLFPQDTMQKTLDQMAADPRTLHLACSLALAERPPSELVIWVIDQFEEVFTLCRDEQERKQFLDNLLYAASIPDGRSMVVLTMRADFYSRCAAYPALSALIASQQFLVSPMDLDGLRQAIEEPAWRVGLEFEEGLVATILDDVANEPGALPLLEHALLELWERRRGRMMTLEAYRETGGVHGALAKRADTIYAAFSAEQQEIVRRIMLRLTAPGEGTEDTRRRATIIELVTSPGEAEAIESVVRAMADARLLTAGADEQSGERLVDVSHEALIRSWPRLRKWIDENRASLRLLRRVTEAAQEWQRLNRDEGVLYRGARLAQALEWREHHEAMLNEVEREFLDASVAEKAREEKEQQERQQRELAQAQALAAEQKKRADDQARAAARLRRRAITAAGAAALAVILLCMSIVLWLRAQEQAKIANEQRIAAQTARDAAEEQARVATAQRLAVESSSALLGKLPQRSLLLAVEAVRVGASGSGMRMAAESLREVLGLVGGRSLAQSKGAIAAVAISPDNHWLVTGGRNNARLWDLSAKDPGANPVVLHGNKSVVNAVAFSPDNHWVVTGSSDKTARLWDLSAKDPATNPAVLRGHEGWVNAVAISPDNRWVVTGSDDNTARLWDLSGKDPAASPVVLRGHDGVVGAVAFSPDSRWVVTGSFGNTARLWDLSAKDPAAKPVVLRGHNYWVNAVAFSPDNRWVVTGSSDKTARLWDLSAKDPAAKSVVLRGHDGPVNAVAFSPDNRWLATGGEEGTIRLWDLSAEDPAASPLVLPGGEPGVQLPGHGGRINAVAISPDNHWLVTGGRDYTVQLWDLTTAKGPGANPLVLRGHEAKISAVAISPNGRWLVTGDLDGAVRLWNLSAKNPAACPLVVYTDFIDRLAIGPDSHWLLTDGGDARLWDLNAKDPAANPLVLPSIDWNNAVAVSPDNRWVVTGSEDKTARLWDLRAKDPAGNPVELRGHDRQVSAVVFSSDNHWLVTGGEDGTAQLWDLTAKDPTANPLVLPGHGFTAVAFSPDNHWLVTGGGEDGTARLWNLSAKNPAANPFMLPGHGFTAVAFSPDNHWLVTGGDEDGTARLWDLTAKDPTADPLVLSGHETRVKAVAFSPDAHFLVTTSCVQVRRRIITSDPALLRSLFASGIGFDDGTARLWDLSAKNPAASPLVLPRHNGLINAMAISPDSHWLVTGGEDGTARLWDLSAKNPQANPFVMHDHKPVPGQIGGFTAMAISPDNHWLVTGGGEDGTARLWDLSAKNPAANPFVLSGHKRRINAVAFSPDNRWLVAGSDDGTTRLWPLQVSDLIDLARAVASRNFTIDEWKLYFQDEPYRKTFPDLPGPD